MKTNIRDIEKQLFETQRRFYPEEMSTDFIGFRCAMSRLGAKNGYGSKKRN